MSGAGHHRNVYQGEGFFIIQPEFLLKEAVQLSDKLGLFDSKFSHEFDGVNIFCQKLTLLA